MKKPKTLKSIKLQYNPNHTSGEPIVCCVGSLKDLAREWIKYLEKQKELHTEWVCHGIGENPDFELPKGFDLEFAYALPYGYDEIIDWIKEFFNLDDKNDEW